jgi:adhesin transport system outer membrane protein
VVDAYNEQFRAGKRTLLDVLSAQNTYINARVLAETAHYTEVFAVYRIMASVGGLVAALRLQPPPAADAYARRQANVPETPPAETMRRYSPERSVPLQWHTLIVR